ncbi:MAG: polysaccharide deacetylase family protein, partial [Planctomycetaceae bacterium]|nr:polysaccharide deacetylase family protein [Planctomycetaceae bacterium]
DTHWDYEKGNLDSAAKEYSVEAGRRVKSHGGRIHYFCVGRVLEQEDVKWLRDLAGDGHLIGNHTYDHVNVLATDAAALQYRFQRSPWLIAGRSPQDVIRDNIRLTTLAMQQRLEVENCGFRTPGGFADGLNGRDDVQSLLLELGFTWVSSHYPQHMNTAAGHEPTAEILSNIAEAAMAAQPFVYPSGLVEIPMSPISDIGAFRTGQWKLDWFLKAIEQTVAATIAAGGVFDFLAHPSCLGVVDPQFRTIDLICDMVAAASDKAELTDLQTIAAAVRR